MKRVGYLALLLSGCAGMPQPGTVIPKSLHETAIEAPGFLDFLAVDGDSVWGTNKGRVERWGRGGRIAEVAMTRPCGGMAVLMGSLWVADCKDGQLVRIDARKASVTARIATGIADPDGETNVVAGAGSIWVPSEAEGRIARVDPKTNRILAEIPVAAKTSYLSFGLGKLWAVSADSRLLQRIDPATNRVTGSVGLGRQPGFLVAGEGAVWVQEQGDGTVARILPGTLELAGRTKVGETLMWGDIDVGAGSVWLRTTKDQTFVQLDGKTGEIVKRYGGAVGSGALRFTRQGIWTTAHDVKRLSWWSFDKPR